MDDIIEQADMLLKDFNSSGYISKYVMEVLPQLAAEIKRLQAGAIKGNAFVEEVMANCNQLRKRCWKAEDQLAAWQKIAIEEYAKFLFYLQYDDDPDPRISWHKEKAERPEFVSKYYDQAAKELGLQMIQEAGYLERLENRLIAFMMDNGPGCTLQEAQVALEKIRKG